MIVCVGRRLLASTFLGLLLSSLTVSHIEAAGPVVAGFERFSKNDKNLAAGGHLLLGELNCVACHQGAAGSVPTKQAPVLDTVGARVRVSYLKKYLLDPQALKPGSTMPQVFEGDPEREAKAEAIAQFLASTGSPKQMKSDAKSVTAGRETYHKIGCVACHGSRDAKGLADKTTANNVPLGDLKAKYTLATLAAFLENPHQARPSGRMPLLLIGDGKEKAKEAGDLANYLIQGTKFKAPTGKGTTVFFYYEGNFEKLPDFTKLKPTRLGVGAAFDLGSSSRRSDYALKFDGVFKVEVPGTFNFHVMSDDGSRLYVDGKQVIDNDGVHPPQNKSGSVKLEKGLHTITLTYFQGQGGDELEAEVEGPGIGRQGLSGLVAADEAALDKIVKPVVAVDDEDHLEIQPALVAKGKALFASAGCANCHQMKGTKPEVKATALASLKPAGGCLAEAPAKGLPWYSLNAGQKSALAEAIKTPAVPTKDPAQIIAKTMLTFNCYACHTREKMGGPEDDLNALFLTNQKEMGDEARIPPALDNVGAKINLDYLKQILNSGSRDRPYMFTRMPAFGAANAGHLVPAFAEVDKGKFTAIADVAFKDPVGKVKATGRHMIGGQAFGCIKCHTFAGNKSEGTQGIDMLLMPQRLQHDWFHAYILDPQKIRQGTRMPSAFDKGKSMLPNLLDGTPAAQIEAMWVYLKDNKKAQLPFGVKKEAIPLTPFKDAIVYRNFIEGSGARAIGVGYPEKVSLAFDANDMRLAMIWQGPFIDAGRHWNGRGVGYEPPLGDNVVHLQSGSAFAVLPKGDEAWPTATPKSLGAKFTGYQLTPDERPTFHYSFGDVKVEDFPNALVTGKDIGLRRALSLTAGKDVSNLFFRAAVGNKIESLGNGVYQIDGSLKIKLTSQTTPIVRSSAGKMELIVPVLFTNSKAQIVQEFSW